MHVQVAARLAGARGDRSGMCAGRGLWASDGTITGVVTIDGQPLDKGVISYVPADSQGQPVTVNIVNGKYTLQAPTGQKYVQVSAPTVVDRRKEYDGPDAPLVEITDERLPPKYNSQTELTFEVKAGDNAKDWAVKSLHRPGK